MSTLSDCLDYFFLDYPKDDLYWTESAWFSWAIPEKAITGFFYVHFRPNLNCMLGGPAMWDRHSRHVWQFPYFDWQTMRPLPEGDYGVDYNKYHFETPWSMSTQMLGPLQRYQLLYQHQDFKLDLIFTAIAEPHVLNAKDPQQLKQAFRTHFEQPGRIQGYVELEGVRHKVDCFSIRDGGHGPRSLENSPPGGYAWCTADPQNAWHILAPNASQGHTTPLRAGYLLRDGVMASLVEGHRKVLQRDGPRPIATEIRATDKLGRELLARGEAQAAAEFMLFPDRGQWWSLYQWQYDDFHSAVGEDQEYYGIQEFRRWHRAGAEAWKQR